MQYTCNYTHTVYLDCETFVKWQNKNQNQKRPSKHNTMDTSLAHAEVEMQTFPPPVQSPKKPQIPLTRESLNKEP